MISMCRHFFVSSSVLETNNINEYKGYHLMDFPIKHMPVTS